jgi:hypothetical protein
MIQLRIYSFEGMNMRLKRLATALLMIAALIGSATNALAVDRCLGCDWRDGGKVSPKPSVAKPMCKKGSIPNCRDRNRDPCGSQGQVQQCWVSWGACEPGVCYCSNGRWQCF